MSGPPPKDPSQRRRRNATPGFKLLPHEGRSGPTPEWPLGDITDTERTIWRELWRLPQAVEWERMAYLRTVARYVRVLVDAEQLGAPTTILGEARQLEDKLGVTPRAMQTLRWETDEPQPETDEKQPASTTRRMRAVEGVPA